MAFGAPPVDPTLAAQLYGTAPDAQPPWPPPHWYVSPEELALASQPPPLAIPGTPPGAPPPVAEIPPGPPPPPTGGATPPPAPSPDPAASSSPPSAAAAAAPGSDAAPASPTVPPGPPPPFDAVLAGAPGASLPAPFLVPTGYPMGRPTAPLPDSITGGRGQKASEEANPADPAFNSTLFDQQTAAVLRNTPWDAQGNPNVPDTQRGHDAAQRYFNGLALRDPQQFAQVQDQLADIKMKHTLAEQARIANADWEQQQANIRMRNEAIRIAQQKSDALAADAQRIANTKIDPTGGLSGGRAIAGVLGAIVGGLVQGRTGSAHNAGMDALNDIINRGIEAQRADLANQRDGLNMRKSLLAEEYARHGDEYQAAETVRLASLKHADDLLAIEQQQYAPTGTTFMRVAALRAGIAAQQQTVLQAVNQRNIDNSLKQQNADREDRLATSTIAKNQADAAKAYADAAKLKGEAAQNQIMTPAQIRAANPLAPEAAIPKTPMTTKQLKEHFEAYNEGLTASNKTTANAMQENSTVIRSPITNERLVGADGSPLRAGDSQIADKLNERLGQTQRFVDTLSDINRDLAGDLSAFSKEKYAAITTKAEKAKTLFINSIGSKVSSREMQAVEEMFGSNFDDFTSRFLSRGKAQARIRALIDSSRQDADTEVGVKLGYKGPSLIKDTSEPPPHDPTPLEESVRRLNTNILQQGTDEMLPEDREWAIANFYDRGGNHLDWFTSPEGQRSASARLPPSKLRIFDELQAAATGGDPRQRDGALSAIYQMAQNGPDEATRLYAGNLLTSVANAPANFPGAPEVTR